MSTHKHTEIIFKSNKMMNIKKTEKSSPAFHIIQQVKEILLYDKVPLTELTFGDDGLRQFCEFSDSDGVLCSDTEHVLSSLCEQRYGVLAVLRHINRADTIPPPSDTLASLQHVVSDLTATVRVWLVPLERYRVLCDSGHLQVRWCARLVCIDKYIINIIELVINK